MMFDKGLIVPVPSWHFLIAVQKGLHSSLPILDMSPYLSSFISNQKRVLNNRALTRYLEHSYQLIIVVLVHLGVLAKHNG